MKIFLILFMVIFLSGCTQSLSRAEEIRAICGSNDVKSIEINSHSGSLKYVECSERTK